MTYELFNLSPFLYIVGLICIASYVFRYVWKHEKALELKHKADNHRPFK